MTIQHTTWNNKKPPVFPDDPSAWAHVASRAHDGSIFHIQALGMTSRIERLGIEAFCGTW